MADVDLVIQDQTGRKEFAYLMVLNRVVLPVAGAAIIVGPLSTISTGIFVQVSYLDLRTVLKSHGQSGLITCHVLLKNIF